MELEVKAVDVVNANRETLAHELRHRRGARRLSERLHRQKRSGAGRRCAHRRGALGLRDLQLPDEQLANRRVRVRTSIHFIGNASVPYETREHSGASTALSMVHRNCNETRKGGIHAKHSLRIRPRILQRPEPRSATRRPLGLPIDKSNVYADKASGKDFDRPMYKRLMKAMRPGDVLVVKSIDRLGRNYDEIIEEWRNVTKRMGLRDSGARHAPARHPRDQGEHNGVFIADLVLQLLDYVAQVERENIRQRQAEGSRQLGRAGSSSAGRRRSGRMLRGDEGIVPGRAYHPARGGRTPQDMRDDVRQMA